MIYQLPNGKVINISIDEYLQLTDEDIQYLMAVDAGDYVNSYASTDIDKIGTDSEEDIGYALEDIFEMPDFTICEDYKE